MEQNITVRLILVKTNVKNIFNVIFPKTNENRPFCNVLYFHKISIFRVTVQAFRELKNTECC